MRSGLAVPFVLLCLAGPAGAQVSVGIEVPGVSIGINLPLYPRLVRVPGYPVYYAPRLNSNYFFYDGMYWVYQGDNWYESTWYNGPWAMVTPEYVPVYVLRVPVRYYRQPPMYFQGWQANAAPRWGDHWGRDWSQRHNGWDHWNHRSAPAPAPLPVYQKQFSGTHYPQAGQQQAIHARNYHYQHHDPVVQQLHPAAPQVARPQAPQREQARPQQAPQHEQARPQPPQHEQARPQAPQQQVRPQAPPHEQVRPQQVPQHEQSRPQAPQARPQQPSQHEQAKPQAPQQPPKPQAPPQARHEQGRPPEGKAPEHEGGHEGNEDHGRDHGK